MWAPQCENPRDTRGQRVSGALSIAVPRDSAMWAPHWRNGRRDGFDRLKARSGAQSTRSRANQRAR